jgi:hypothetical protein
LTEDKRIAEVIEAFTNRIRAQCYQLFDLPPFGSMLWCTDNNRIIYAITSNATTTSLDTGRRPVARGQNHDTPEDIFTNNPQLEHLFRSEFEAIIIGYQQDKRIFHYLPPNPVRVHSFVYPCGKESVAEFSQNMDFLPLIINCDVDIPIEELVAASLRNMSQAHQDPAAFLIKAGKALAELLSHDFLKLRTILSRLK